MPYVSSESAPIYDFDVAPTHGRVVYVAGNQLIEVDPATGKKSFKLVATPHEQLVEDNQSLEAEIQLLLSPRYAPDGSQIAYIQGGVNMITSGFEETVPRRILTSTHWLPARTATTITVVVNWSDDARTLRDYQAIDWAPDGQMLAVGANLWEGWI